MQDIKSYTKEEIQAIYNKPLLELLYEAATVHRQHHDPREVQVSKLLSIKTGGCPEDCGYCPQAARYHTDIKGNDLMSVDEVKDLATDAKSNGSSRVCMGAAWRNVKDDEEFDQVLEMVRTVRDMDMEVCCTLVCLPKIKLSAWPLLVCMPTTTTSIHPKIFTKKSFQLEDMTID
jgi:biotin synthase